jgi:Ca2+-binding EF-hand superfamily protein
MQLKSIALAVFISGVIAAPALSASALETLDADNDGTLDLAEVKAGADKEFDKLDKDKDGTLDRKELQGRVSKKDWASADPDHDGTLTKEEYEAQVAAAFKRADPDDDGTLDKKELQTPNGQAVLRLAR